MRRGQIFFTLEMQTLNVNYESFTR